MGDKVTLNIRRSIETVESVEADLVAQIEDVNYPKNAGEKATISEVAEILRVDDMADGRSPIGINLPGDRYLTCEVGNAGKDGDVYKQWLSCREERWDVGGNDQPYVASRVYRLFEITSSNTPDYVGTLPVKDNPATPEIETSSVKVYEYAPKIERRRP